MKRHRMEQVDHLLQREIGLILIQRVSDPRARMITITGVETSRDLKHARVFFTVIGDTPREEIEEILRKAAGFIRAELGARVRLKYTPDLQFRYDDSTERGSRVINLLKELEEAGEVSEAPTDEESSE